MAFEKLIPQIAQNPQVMLQAAIAAQQAANQRKQFAIQNSQNIGDALLKAWQMKKAGDQQAIENQMAERKMGFEEDKFGKTFGLQERKFEELDLERLAMEGRLTDAQIDHMASQDILNEVQADRLRKLMPSEVSRAESEATVAEVGAEFAKPGAEVALSQAEEDLRARLIANNIDEETANAVIEVRRRQPGLDEREMKVREGQLEVSQFAQQLQQQRDQFATLKEWNAEDHRAALINLEKEKMGYTAGIESIKTSKDAVAVLQKRAQFWDAIAAKPSAEKGFQMMVGEGASDEVSKAHARSAANKIREEMKRRGPNHSYTNQDVIDIFNSEPEWTATAGGDGGGGAGGGAGGGLTDEERANIHNSLFTTPPADETDKK